jgi:uncharacterized membrane protein YphA (DoxX/SURF4 family)
MRRKPLACRLSRATALLGGTLAAAPAAAHEAWLLTPSEVEALARAPLPALFTSTGPLALAALVGALIAAAAVAAEDRLRPLEQRLLAPAAALAPEFGPVALRLGLAAMLALSALGGLPRHGTALWTTPTLFVPDMQLALAPGWAWLAPVELGLALFLAAGLATRAAGLAVAALALVGLVAFGSAFLAYAPHFVAPGIMLAICGGGAFSVDRAMGVEGWLRPGPRLAPAGWAGALVLLGGGFVYLGVVFKLTQPTLLMAILEHGQVPLLGLPLALAALLMTGVEVIAGALLALGRLTRPIALLLIGAFTFFAVTIGESPLFHAQLYGTMAMLALSGRVLPDAAPSRPVRRTVAA